MKYVSFCLLGVFFGILMTKSEAISWFRIHEMFRFESIHMYGIIGVAVLLSIPAMWYMKKKKIKTMAGHAVTYKPKKLNYTRYLLAGTIFGLGWALMGACPGPIYVLIGGGYYIYIVVLIGALIGTLIYGLLRDRLPH
ncbi:MAG TPA: YeeE/YedE family protein [Saprospiraceae bacterium]|nr:YeeE/YedE family protein [Saprospiraceae bacterium]